MNTSILNKVITVSVLIIVIIAVILLLSGGGDKATLKLNGESSMTIYQYEQFIDPGYEIIDADNDSGFYTNIDGVVNTNVVGTYNLTYYLYNKSGKLVSKAQREVKVLEDNLSNLKMYLKGDAEEYFFVNDYVDHGIDAYNNTTNVSDRVNIVSDVKSDVVGKYEVHYQVTSGTNLKEVVRTVYIVDYSIEEEIDYINKMINLTINCQNYDYTAFPNGTKYYSKYIHYDFNDIGTYEFNIYLKSGSHKAYVVDIKSIDKEGPKGTCSLSYENSRTTITMNVKDDSGVKKYSYNGLDFYGNTTVINSMATNVMVRAYDKYDNYSDIKCKATYGTAFRNIQLTSNGNIANKSFIVFPTNFNKENQELDNLMQSYGYLTRDAVAAAATYLAQSKYDVPYFWGGKWVKKGFNPEWGSRHSHTVGKPCSKPLASDNSYCEWGLDCTGYTSWSFAQAGFPYEDIRKDDQSGGRWGKSFIAKNYRYAFSSANLAYANQIKPGDIVATPGVHVGIVIGVSEDTIQVANEWGGIKISIIRKSNGSSTNHDKSFSHFVLMDEFYKAYGNS